MGAPANLESTSSLLALIAQQVQAAPAAIALEFQGHTLSYAALDAWSNRLAQILSERGVTRGVLAGVLAARSLETVVSILGILKAGGAYVPLDPAHGDARIEQILKESQPAAVVGTSPFTNRFGPVIPSAACVSPSETFTQDVSDGPPGTDVHLSDLAYVIFTSGSTGKPKGVEIEHRSLLNLLRSMVEQPGFTASDTLLAVTTLAFDIAGLELFLPLIAGGRVVIAPGDVVSDGKRLMDLLERSGATVMQATPATWRLLFGAGWQGHRKLKVLIGGEALSPDLGRQLAGSCQEVWNVYGPTETTIWSSIYRVTGGEDRLVPIGKPIANTSFHILHNNLQPVAAGQEGELFIGGDGLARGYLGRPDLTKEKFVHDPFSSSAGRRLYRTGDIARFRADGNVEFLGRADHQVKIRGFRIELGEIESVLEKHPAVRQAVVSATEQSGPEKQLIAYVSPAESQPLSIAELRQHVSRKLPNYMMPAVFVQLARFPLTPNGKVDRKALPLPAPADLMAGHAFVAPRNRSEQQLAAIWEEILGVRPIGCTVRFFDLGGRSLQAAQLFLKIGKVFGRDLPLSTLFRASTIQELAQELSSAAPEGAYATLVPIQPHGSRPPFFCVHGGAGSTLFLQSLASHLDADQPFFGIEPEGLDGKAFERTTIEAMAAHYISEILKIQPKGPYRIGGYCFGGIVAVEMAQQLRRIGTEIALVALFSAPLRFNRLRSSEVPLSRSLTSRAGRLLRSPGGVISRQIQNLRTSSQLRLCFALLKSTGSVPPSLRTFYVDQMLRRAEWEYVPSFYPGTLSLFRGSGLYDNDQSMGWEGLADRLTHHVIGNTETNLRRQIMDEPLVELLARELTQALEESSWRGLSARGDRTRLAMIT